MSKYFFNVVLNGQPAVDRNGQDFPDDNAARAYAYHLTMLLADRCRDSQSSFVAVIGLNGRLAFKVPFLGPGSPM